ncbi:hypothetical protein DASC09_006140 [Saccharomycopsis crataegensis]|uniref:Aspartate/glutamate racemase family protein n=1 Tax=Saccharomycopsis crataegensis TaxID=43959 RepID=A0AAV5QF48_9ASCO|nr:hypothetical protein DASC09_006140 [Saccharomycopsis crataegensis]
MSKYPPNQELPPLGALCLDYTEDIHRPPGDPLNPDSFEFPLVHAFVKDATVTNVVFSGVYDDEFIAKFVEGCNELERKGAIGVITSCGFLAQLQSRISGLINIPIASSSLLQIPSVMALLPPQKKLAILTFDKDNLGKAQFDGVGIPEEYQKRLVVYGAKAGKPLKNIIIEGSGYVAEDFEAEMVELAQEALADTPSVGAFVLECTQMPPTAKAIQKATGLPVYNVVTMIDWFYSGLVPKTFPEDPNKEEGYKTKKRSAKEKGPGN